MRFHPRAGESVRLDPVGPPLALNPAPLPPTPDLAITPAMAALLEDASVALGKLDSIGGFLPNPDHLLYLYIRKEAVLSSQIEGTQSSLSDLLAYENAVVPGITTTDAAEVSRYVAALQVGLDAVRQQQPITIQLILDMHRELMKGSTRGGNLLPGEFRTAQNWIGGDRPESAKFVPPPVQYLAPALQQLENYMQQPGVPALLRAGLVHYQFETIHPFFDGNGRLGRILIVLLLCAEGRLSAPYLYISLYLKAHRSRYYAALQAVRQEGAFEQWVEFFLRAVTASALDAFQVAQQLVMKGNEDKSLIAEIPGSSSHRFQAHEILTRKIIVNQALLVKEMDISWPTANKILADFSSAGLVREISGKKRDRVYVYQSYLTILGA